MRLREIIRDTGDGEPRLQLNTDGDGGRVWIVCPHCILANIPDGERTVIRLPFTRGKGTSQPVTWGWNGETDLEKVTFTPSVHILEGHWHGHIQNGEVTQPGNTQ